MKNELATLPEAMTEFKFSVFGVEVNETSIIIGALIAIIIVLAILYRKRLLKSSNKNK